MVDSHYIKRGNKLYGPYYYRSYRVGKKVKKEYLGKNYIKKIRTKKTIKSLSYFFVLLILMASILYLATYFFGITSKATAEFGSTTLENNESSQAPSENLMKGIIDSISSTSPQANLSELANITLNETATEENESNVSEINTTYPLVEQLVVNLSNATNTKEQPAEVKATILNETLIQHKAEIDKPVKWTKKVILEKPSNITVELPKEADNITVKKIENESSEIILVDSLGITGQVTSSINLTGRKKELTYFDLIKYLLRKIRAKITGHAIEETVEVKTETIEPEKIIEIKENVTEVEVEYYTEAPAAIEKISSQGKKDITITGPDSVHYTDVLAYTSIDEAVPLAKKNDISLYHLVNETKEKTEFNAYDDNSNGFIDRIEWLVPSLSNQSYEVDITIINVQSYPTVGGNWDVYFKTIGQADLTITATNGTKWSNSNENNDLKFLELKCGENSQQYEWIDNSVFVKDYQCSETGTETSKVLTAGKHTLKFQFGSDVEYAFNQAQFTMTITANSTANFSHAYQYTFDDSANPDTVSSGTELTATEYASIGRVGFGAVMVAGTNPNDAHVRINYTTPPNEGIYWINITCIMNSTAPIDTYAIYIWNWTKGASDYVASAATNATAWRTLTANLTERANITGYTQAVNGTQQELEVWCSARGNTIDTLAVDYAAIQIKYNGTTPPLITPTSPSNTTYTRSVMILGFNVTLDKDGGGCVYSLNGSNNVSMASDANLSFWNATVSVNLGSQYVQFYCNNSVGEINASGQKYYFYMLPLDLNISGCSNVTQSGKYTLNKSITNWAGTGACINITASDVEVDCIGNNYQIDGTDIGAYGIIAEGLSTSKLTNVSIKNCNLSDWGVSTGKGAIELEQTQNSTIDNITALSNGYFGLRLDYSSRNNLSNITTSNGNFGIMFVSSTFNTVINMITSSNSDDGVYLISPDNTFINITTSSNGRDGFYMQPSYRNQIINSTIRDNKANGLEIITSQYNNITGSRIENNSVPGQAGIYINTYIGTVTYNRFWNNIINNTYISGGRNWKTYSLGGQNYTNYFNTTKIAGTNIIGGSWIAGNWWSDYTGTSSDGDYIGDTPYVINATYMNDSLPLVYADSGGIDYNISACRNITQTGTYTLNKSITDWASPTGEACINISVSDVEINCVGWENWIDGQDTSNTIGIKAEGLSNAKLTNVSIKNCNLTDWGDGDYHVHTENSTLSNITAVSNTYGIALQSNSSKNNLTNITATGNTQYGIYLFSNNKNQIINSTIRDNKQYGIYLNSSSFNNITNSTIENNSVSGYAGIYISSSATDATSNSSYNRFWNNIINNTVISGGKNWNLTGINYTNYFNTTKTSGTNIISGAFIAGNYWSDYTGADADGDGIGDTPYVINATYMNDSLPLLYNNPPNITLYAPNNESTETSPVIFVYNVTDDNNIANCSLITGGSTVQQTDTTVTKNINQSITQDLSAGTYIWQINCTDAGNNMASSVKRTVTIPDYNISACRNITNAGTYKLNKSITNWAGQGACINVTVSNVEIDCIGWENWIDGQDTSNTIGIKAEGLSNAKLTNVSIKNCNLTDWGDGDYHTYTQNSTITNITASSNSQDGINLSSSSNNQIINSTIRDNKNYGLYLSYSRFNNITGNRIENNSISGYAGIYIYSHASTATSNSSYNRIWDNIINNTAISGGLNWKTFGINYTNYFNTTKVAGTNILGRSWIAGNWWSDYSGTSSDGDYIGDTPYVINATYMNDSLPLVLTDSGAGETPKIVFMLPTPDDGIRQTRNWIYVNVSVNTTNNNVDTCLLEWNSGGGPANETMNKIGTGINVTCWANKTTVDGTTYTYKVYANDSTNTFGNSSSRSNLENSRPGNVSLIYPAHSSSITNRTPQLNWSASSDAESDSITYQINITCYPSCSADNRLFNNSATNQNWTNVSSRLKYFWDDLYYYNWTVRAWDGYEFGDWNLTPYTLKLSSLISLSMLNASVNFTAPLSIGQTVNTTTDNPFPLSIQNDGNSFVSINMSNDTALIWSTQQSPSSYYQYKIDNVTGENISFNWTGSITTWTNVPVANVTPITFFNYTDASDSAEIDILVTVPPAEPPGAKSSRLVFTGWYVRET